MSEKLNEIIKGLIFDVVLKALINRIILKAPYLALPVINPVFIFVMTKLTGLIYDEICSRVSLVMIDFKVESERLAYQNAVEYLKFAQVKNDPETIKKAEQTFRDTLADLIRFK